MKIIKVEQVSGSKFLRFFKADYIDQNGNENVWTFVSRNEKPICEVGGHSPNAVVIAAIHKPSNKLVLGKEFRVTIDNYEIGFPAGLIDEGETLETCAARELFEETGLRLTEVIKVSPPLYSSIGMTDESVVMVYCLCEGEPSTEHNEASEDISVMMLDQNEVYNLIWNADGDQDDDQMYYGAKAWIVMEKFADTGRL